MSGLLGLLGMFAARPAFVEPEAEMHAPVGPFFLHEDTRVELLAESERRRQLLAERRVERERLDRGDMRLAMVDSRGGTDRRFHTMDDKLRAESQTHDGERRFSGASLPEWSAA